MTTNPTCPKCGKPLSWLSESQLPERTFPIHIDTGKEECEPVPRLWQYCEHSGTPALEPTTPPPSPSTMEGTPETDEAEERDAHLFQILYPHMKYHGVKGDRMRLLERELTAYKAALAKEREEHLRTSERLVATDKAYMIELESNETSRANEQKLAAEVDDLKSWRESASQVFNDLNLQAIGKELGLRLGSNIAKEILPRITRERAVRRELEKALERISGMAGRQPALMNEEGLRAMSITVGDEADAALAASRALDDDKHHVA